ncbi:hypothetical protein P0F65_05090 [Sphingomonas sp. I4]
MLTITGVALMAVSYLARKTPKPDSAGSQLSQKLDPQAGVPIAFGRTATGGVITDRLTWGAKNAFYGIVTVLSAGGPIAGIEAYRAGDYPILFNTSPAYATASVTNVGGYSGNSKLYRGKLRQRWQNGDAPATTTPAAASGFPMRGGALSGLAHVVTSYEYSADAFPKGCLRAFGRSVAFASMILDKTRRIPAGLAHIVSISPRHGPTARTHTSPLSNGRWDAGRMAIVSMALARSGRKSM